jgi:cbb3-type cytochrome oxidase subunit 3
MKNALIILFLLLSVCLFIFLYRRAKKTYKDAKENSLEEFERWKDEKIQEYLSKKRQEEENRK